MSYTRIWSLGHFIRLLDTLPYELSHSSIRKTEDKSNKSILSSLLKIRKDRSVCKKFAYTPVCLHWHWEQQSSGLIILFRWVPCSLMVAQLFTWQTNLHSFVKLTFVVMNRQKKFLEPLKEYGSLYIWGLQTIFLFSRIRCLLQERPRNPMSFWSWSGRICDIDSVCNFIRGTIPCPVSTCLQRRKR